MGVVSGWSFGLASLWVEAPGLWRCNIHNNTQFVTTCFNLSSQSIETVCYITLHHTVFLLNLVCNLKKAERKK